MIFGKTKLELKVGVFVFAGVIILAMFVLSIGKYRTWTSGYRVNFVFNFVNGVKVGAPIRFAGVDVGEIKAIKFYFSPQEGKTKVYLASWIRHGVMIPLDSTVWVNTLGILGEKYIEIIPGSDYRQVLAANKTMVGTDPMPTHELFLMAKGFVEGLTNKEGTIGKLLYDPTVYNNLEAFTDDVRKNPWKLLFKTKEKK